MNHHVAHALICIFNIVAFSVITALHGVATSLLLGAVVFFFELYLMSHLATRSAS